MDAPQILSSKDTSQVSSTCETYNITPQEFTELARRATAAKATAYCPYSQFRVGATLLAQNGSFVSGANVENASYPVGTCAERVALGTAVVGGLTGGFRALAVATDTSPPASPCGMCRQFIREFCALEMPILMFDKNQDYVVLRLGQLLPLSFGPDQLPSPKDAQANAAKAAAAEGSIDTK